MGVDKIKDNSGTDKLTPNLAESVHEINSNDVQVTPIPDQIHSIYGLALPSIQSQGMAR